MLRNGLYINMREIFFDKSLIEKDVFYIVYCMWQKFKLNSVMQDTFDF